MNAILCVGEKTLVGTMEGATEFTYGVNDWQVNAVFTSGNGLLSNVVNVLAADEKHIYFGSYLDNKPGGISILGTDGWEYITVENGLCHPYINAILPSEEKIYVATGQLTAGGLCLLNETKDGFEVQDVFGTNDGIPGEKVRWLYKDTLQHLWITTESDGLLICPNDTIDHPIESVLLKQEHGLSDNEIKKIVESEQYYWLGGRYGLTRIEKQAVNQWLEGVRNDEKE